MSVERAFDGRSAKAQGKLAGKSGAQFVVTVEEGRVWLKDFGVSGERARVGAADVPGADTTVHGSDFLGLTVAAGQLPEAIVYLRSRYR